MLHLFNSCYVYPDVLFDPTNNYIVVGKNIESYGVSVEKSFYYVNKNVKSCLGRYATTEKFVSSNMLKPALYNKERLVIYADDTEFLNLFTAQLKTQCANLTKQFFLDACKLMSVKLKTRAKTLASESARDKINALANMFASLNDIPSMQQFPLDKAWVKANAGIEWKIAVGDYSTAPKVIDKYAYSFFEEAKMNYLSRKDPAGSWVEDQNNQSFDTVVSMEDLYKEIRKEVMVIGDKFLMDYYQTKNIDVMIKNPRFLFVFSSNKDMADKIDIWLLRWMMLMPESKLKELGVVA